MTLLENCDPNLAPIINWRTRVSIPVPRRCERRALPIELIPLTLSVCSCVILLTQKYIFKLMKFKDFLFMGTVILFP